MTEVVEEMGVAKWSMKTKQDAEGSFRVLEGEILLGKELQPSCGFALFSVQVCPVCLLSFTFLGCLPPHVSTVHCGYADF
jgi:hypothetical protein